MDIKSFFLGILAALFALFFELAVSIFIPGKNQVYLATHVSFFLVFAVLIEEIFKLAVIYKVSQPMERRWPIIVTGIMVGIGFSAAEIFLNYYSRTDFLSVPLRFLLGMAAVHIFTSFFAGVIVSQKENRYYTVARVLIFNFTIHLLYNLAVIFFF